MNGGELDGVRILPKARLDEMMAPNSRLPDTSANDEDHTRIAFVRDTAGKISGAHPQSWALGAESGDDRAVAKIVCLVDSIVATQLLDTC